jgi:hypothetical protein
MKTRYRLHRGDRASAVVVACVAVLYAFAARAFPKLEFWHAPASGETEGNDVRPGADGIYGTGGPSELGIQCAHCHIDGAGMIDVQIDTDPPFGTAGNDKTYVPGQAYDFTVTLIGQHLGEPEDERGNINGFVATFEDASGNVMGSLTSDTPNNSSANCPSSHPEPEPATTTYVMGDCHGILFTANHDQEQWLFRWQAPAAGAGDVTMWWGAVDGNTSGESSLDDDTKQGNLLLIEG